MASQLQLRVVPWQGQRPKVGLHAGASWQCHLALHPCDSVSAEMRHGVGSWVDAWASALSSDRTYGVAYGTGECSSDALGFITHTHTYSAFTMRLFAKARVRDHTLFNVSVAFDEIRADTQKETATDCIHALDTDDANLTPYNRFNHRTKRTYNATRK